MKIRAGAVHSITNVTLEQQWSVEVRPTKHAALSRLIVRGVDVGYACEGVVYPSSVTVLRVETTAGTLAVASHALPYEKFNGGAGYAYGYDARHGFVKKLRLYGNASYYEKNRPRAEAMFRRSYTDDHVVHDRSFYVGLGNSFDLQFDTVDAFGATDIYQVIEYAFWRTEKGTVTNGEIVFPAKRPVGDKWHYHGRIAFAKKISAKSWPLLLRAVEGKFFSGINTIERVRDRMRLTRILDQGRKRLRKVNGECTDGKIFDELEDVEISVGERLVFYGRKNGVPVYVVDSPNYGVGLYVFSAVDDARSWANGLINMQVARAKAIAFVPHNKGWEQKATRAVEMAAVVS